MIIKLSPIAADKTTTVSLNGLILTVDGIDIDLSLIPVGGQAEASADSPLIGICTRDEVTVKYHYDSSLAEPNQSNNIAEYTFDIISGEVPSPIKWRT